MKWRLLSGLIALLPFFATAQTYDELNKEFQKYYSKADYEKSIQLGEKTIEAAKRENKTGDSSYIILVNNLGGAYFLSAQYVKAEPLLILTKEIVKEKFGEKNNNYPAVLSTLGAMYEKMGKYEKAESSILEGMKILREVSGSESQAYWSCLSNLSNLYVTIGQYEKGETYVLQALEIIKKMQGENSPDYSTNIANLAYLYKTTGQYEKAEPLYIKAAELKKTLHGETHQNYVQVLNNLGTMYSSMGQYKKAEPLLNQALEIRYKIFGENSPFYATSLNNLAILYEAMGEYEKAEPLYSKCLAIRKQTLGEGHPDYAQILNNIAIFYIRWGKLSKAEPMLLSATEIIIQNLKKVFSILSEKEKTNYLSNNIRQTGLINSLQYKYTKASPAMSLLNFNLQLFFKTLSLTYTRNMLETVNSSSDSSILNTVKEWQLNKRTLARQYALPANKRVAQLDSIEAKTESLEKELTRKSADFRYQQSLTEISIKEVQKNLAADEVAVEFFRFRLITNSKTDSTRYAAYILQKQDSTPVFVPLFEERQLLQLLSNAGKTATSTAKMFYRGMEIKDRNTPSGRELYQLIWQPLEPYLKGIKKISYSPAGKLYSIAFHALPIDSATLLMDKYNLQQYVSTRQVALRTKEKEIVKPGSIVLFGNANFSMDSLQLVSQRTNLAGTVVYPSVYTPSTRGSNTASWPSLPGTAEEIKQIGDLFTQNRIITKSFNQKAASEENLKALSGNAPQILHIATHGFFLPEPDRNKTSFDQGNTYTLADDPLLRSGLILAGGNYAWSGKIPIEGVEDGIATAYEISQLNLSNTELVVLSACETALGDVKGSEGVFGLQRAFKMAGAKKMIVSLWKVPDTETAELMTAFYSYWMKGKTINGAFQQAQADMRKRYSPFYWAGFVLVE